MDKGGMSKLCKCCGFKCVRLRLRGRSGNVYNNGAKSLNGAKFGIEWKHRIVIMNFVIDKSYEGEVLK